MDQAYFQTPETITIEKLLKGNDVAKLLNVSRSFAYTLMKSGELPTVRLGRSVRVRLCDLQEFITMNIQHG